MALDNFRVGRARVFAFLICHAFGWSAASAAELTLREAVVLTSERNPQLRAFGFESEAMRQHGLVRAMAPPLSVDVQLENFAGSGEVSGVKALETTLQLSKVVELGGKAQRRSELGAAELESLAGRQAALRADLAAETARRFVHVLADQAQLDVRSRASVLAERARDAVEARIREGAISSVFLHRAEIELARARIEQEHAEHELAASRTALAVMWGDEEARFERAVGDLFEFPDIEPLERYVARLDGNPDLLQFAAEQRAIDARQRLAESARAPNVTFSAGVRRLEASDDQAFVAGFSVPFGARKRTVPELRAAAAERERLSFNAAAHRLDLHARLFGFYQEILHARMEANVLRTDIRPQAQRMVETTTEGYRQGRYSLVELIDAQRSLLEIERDAVRAAREFHANLIEIERATGAR